MNHSQKPSQKRQRRLVTRRQFLKSLNKRTNQDLDSDSSLPLPQVDKQRKPYWKHALSTITVLVFILFLIVSTYYFWRYHNTDEGMVPIRLTDEKKLAINLTLDALRSIGNLSVAMISGLISLFFVFPRLVSNRRLFFIAWLTSIGLLVISFSFYFIGYKKIIETLYHHGTVDITSPYFQFWIEAQVNLFLLALFSSFLTVLNSITGGRHDSTP